MSHSASLDGRDAVEYSGQPQPGDPIVVPRRVVTPATLRTLRDIVQIVFQSVSTLGVVAALAASL